MKKIVSLVALIAMTTGVAFAQMSPAPKTSMAPKAMKSMAPKSMKTKAPKPMHSMKGTMASPAPKGTM